MECYTFPINATLFLFILTQDKKEAEDRWGKVCPHCKKGKLRWSNWSRKYNNPFEVELPDKFDVMFSLCCDCEGCRKRVTPVSIRFPIGSPNTAVTLILVELLSCGASSKRVANLVDILKVDERTIRRWLKAWRNPNVLTAWWKSLSDISIPFQSSVSSLWNHLQQRHKDKQISFQKLIELSRTLWPKWLQ